MSSANVTIINETTHKMESNWELCFQYCKYKYENGDIQEGYRFIWRRPDGTLQPARGQARIPSLSLALKLVSKAMSEGWGFHNGEEIGYEFPEDNT